MSPLSGIRMRKWCYCQKPGVYEVYCDICAGSNTTWSEYEHMIWCYDCGIDTKGDGGIFDGPIPIELAQLMGMSFDRIRLVDNKILKWSDWEDDKSIYEYDIEDVKLFNKATNMVANARGKPYEQAAYRYLDLAIEAISNPLWATKLVSWRSLSFKPEEGHE